MKRAFVLFIGIVLISTSAISEHRHEILADDFDGAKLMKRYNASKDDFHAEYVGDKMFVVVHDGAPIPDPPIFEAPDPTKRDRLTVLRGNLRSRDLNVSEINEYLRLTAGL